MIHHRTRNPGLRMSRLCIIAQGFLCVICEFGVSWKRSSLYPDPMKACSVQGGSGECSWQLARKERQPSATKVAPCRVHF